MRFVCLGWVLGKVAPTRKGGIEAFQFLDAFLDVFWCFVG